MKSYHQKFISNHPYESVPMAEISGFPVRPGIYDLNGATPLQNGVNFTIHTCGGTSCELLLFHRAQEEPFAVIPFPDAYKIGDVYSMIVYGLNIEEFEYAYRVDGPYRPEKGLLFDKNNILLDPYAKAVAGQRTWGIRWDHNYHARVVRDRFDWGDTPQSKKELCDLIIYELHVRDFTHHPSSGVRHRGTFSGLMEKIPYLKELGINAVELMNSETSQMLCMEKIPYLKELGINAVELMPIFEFDETMNSRTVDGKQLLECWGYNTVGFFAPNSSYAAANEHNQEGTEFKTLIRELHANGIEVILDVVFNHTAEGNEKGKTISFKGLDNNIYYMLTPDGNYYNFSGCGNTLNCNHPVVQQLILECLRYWTINYRVDGFRFDLASILGRNEDGSPMNNPPLLRTLANDPILSNVKLIAEAWDRSFLKGDCWHAWDAAWSISGSGDLYGGFYDHNHSNYAGYNSCVNFLTCHDGFTLYDLYSYNEKHNEANGWNNTDGADDNRSWNCGVEGDTDDPEVLALRRRMIRNACAVLMCSRGTPMFLSGDEFGNTKFGNNNSYCQDNITSWLDWRMLEKNKDLFEFFKFMIAFRKQHPVIHKQLPTSVCGMDPIHTHNVNADQTDIPRDARTFCVSFAGYDKKKGHDDLIYIAVNTFWEDVTITLPDLHGRGAWHLNVNTYGDGNGKYCYPDEEAARIDHSFVMRSRSVAVFTGKDY